VVPFVVAIFFLEVKDEKCGGYFGASLLKVLLCVEDGIFPDVGVVDRRGLVCC
jgi:hypothetical protein